VRNLPVKPSDIVATVLSAREQQKGHSA
jgi:hypothetical protein